MAQEKVTTTLIKMKNIQGRMLNFRDTDAIIDPEKQTAPLVGVNCMLQSILLSVQME